MRAAITVMALVALAAPSSAQGLELEWSAADRLGGVRTIDELAPERPVAVRLHILGRCPAEVTWKLDGDPVTPKQRPGCNFDLAMSAGEHEVEAEAGGETVTERVAPKDVVVVSLGDSVASGEGNPDGPPGPRWLEPRCNRSLRSGAAHAAGAVERADPHSVVTFVPLGCSGATIEAGLLGPYAGIAPDRRKGQLRPQVDPLSAIAAKREIGAVMLSVGANDVHFGPAVRFCMRVDPCDERRFDPESAWREAPNPETPTAAEVVRTATADLRAGYDRLAARLGEEVRPERVLIYEYFDPLRDESGETCADALPGVRPNEANWARHEVLEPLNAEVRAAAERHGWQVVRGVAPAFRTHGICVGGEERWIRRPGESIARQLTLTGTFHPNERGHLATAALIAPQLAGTLELDINPAAETSGRGDAEHDGYVRWYWLIVAALAGAAALALGGRFLGSRG
jgi:hypothetical protein